MKTTHVQKYGVFCEAFGTTPRNAILELFLESREVDFSVSDIARETGMTRMTTHTHVKNLVKEKLLVPSRKVAGTQLYKLVKEKESRMIAAYVRIFDEILLPMVGTKA